MEDKDENIHDATEENNHTSLHHEVILDPAHLDDILSEKLERAFHKQTSQLILHDIVKIAIEHDPIDLAYAVTRLPLNARFYLYENLPDIEAKVVFMINTTSNTRSTIFRQIRDQEIKQLLDNMPPDEAVDILEDMSNRRLKRVLELLEPKKALRIRKLQKHERNSAGRLMSDEFFAFSMNTTIGEASRYIRDNPGIDLTRSIFVLTEHNELAGFVPVRNLIVNPSFLPLRQVMQPVLHTVTTTSSRDEVVDIVERYSIPTLPVVDEFNHLLGVIAYDDVVEAMEDIADETIAAMAGTEDISEDEPIFKRYLWRAPWLAVTLLGGIVTSTTMSQFNGKIWFTIVPFFVPLIAGMSGNVGLQSSTILVRGMATGELSPGTRLEAIMKELGIGLLIGLTFGIACGLLIYLLSSIGVQTIGGDPASLGFVVSCGVFGACMTATVLGSFSPFFFARMGIDPAVASGPIVTAFNDVTATIMFMCVARVLYFFIP